MRLSTFIFWSIAVSYVYGQCGETKFTEENGTISSLIPYKKGVTCVYTISVVSKDWISLSWEKFKVHGDMPWCMKDRLEIYTGCTTKKLMATFCSDNLASKVPHKIYTQNSCLEIRLISDDKDAYEGNIYIGFTGFTINYKTGVGSAGISYGSCRRSQGSTAPAGVIASPNWPKKFVKDDIASSSSGGSCNWEIYTFGSKVIQITVMDVDFSGGGSYCSYKNNLYIKGKHSNERSRKYSSRHCSRSDPFTLNPRFHTMVIELNGYKSPHSPPSDERGFVIGYLAYKYVHKPPEPVEWGMIIGIIIGILVVVIAIIAIVCIVRRYRAWREEFANTPTVGYRARADTVTPTPQVQTPLNDKSHPKTPPPEVDLPPPIKYPLQQTDHLGEPPPYPGPPAGVEC